MEEKDYIKDLFSEKLGNHSVQVNPELWSAIASKLPVTSVVSSGFSLTSKVLIGLGTAASIIVATFLLMTEKDVVKKVEKTEKTNKEISVKNNITENNLVSEQNKKDPPLPSICCAFGLPVDIQENELIVENNITTELPVISESENKQQKPVISNQEQVISEEKKTNEEPKIITETKSDLVIGDLPNIFTPNNDKENDLFSIEIKGLSDFSISILNSENKIVFTSTDPNFKWDGKDFSENLVPTGNYFYFFTGMDSNKKAVSKSNMLKVHY